jgi:serine/threonine protein phosphatase 1
MRLLAIGDIHGCSRALTALLAAVAPGPRDRLVTVGDYVDRGPDSRGVLDLLIPWQEAGRLVALRGNHEQMMLWARRGGEGLRMWLLCGGLETLASYGVVAAGLDALDDIPERHWRFVEHECVDWYETDCHFFVHANAYSDLVLPEQPEYMLFWEKLEAPCDHVSGKVMVCGHTPQRQRVPLNLGTTICIDTGVYEANGWLTCLDVHSGQYWQANETGEVRTGRLAPPA